MDPDERTNEMRPWPVHVLSLLAVTGALLGFVVGDRSLWDIATAVVGLYIAYSLWMGRAWAFTVSFMLATLCAGAFLAVALVQVLLLEQGMLDGLLWGLASATIWTGLLMHPATKRFAGLKRPSEKDLAGQAKIT